jgi:hypothetical protein
VTELLVYAEARRIFSSVRHQSFAFAVNLEQIRFFYMASASTSTFFFRATATASSFSRERLLMVETRNEFRSASVWTTSLFHQG